MKTKELYNNITTQLHKIYAIEEAGSIAKRLMEAFWQLGQTDIIVNQELTFDSDDYLKLNNAISSLLEHKPIQYVLGEAHFYGRNFIVNHNVLIPRNETEELIQLIINENKSYVPSILDIGTGTGCIPITLFLELQTEKVEAIDISNNALKVAKLNAERHGTNINFYNFDVLSDDSLPGVYDIIVSNPPYVTHSEKDEMKLNVLNHEPHLALFVNDLDPLIFYDKIIKKSVNSLKRGGKLYFEINERFGNELVQKLEIAGFQQVGVLKDLNDKDRMVRGVLA